jgi:hypothetical protein
MCCLWANERPGLEAHSSPPLERQLLLHPFCVKRLLLCPVSSGQYTPRIVPQGAAGNHKVVGRRTDANKL